MCSEVGVLLFVVIMICVIHENTSISVLMLVHILSHNQWLKPA